MFGTRREINERLDDMHDLLQRIEAALVVRDPGTARSVEAYEGLRKAVVGAMKERRQHLAQLISFSEAIERGASMETLAARVKEWCMEAGLRRWDKPEPIEFFQIIEGDGPRLEVITPAWVDDAGDGSVVLIKQGTARRTSEPRLQPDDVGVSSGSARVAERADQPDAVDTSPARNEPRSDGPPRTQESSSEQREGQP